MRLKIISILLVLLLPFAFAMTLIQPIGVANGQFQVNGTCNISGVAVGLQAALGLDTVFVSETVANNLREFTFVFTPPQDGNYTFVVACENELFQQGQACIGAQCQGAAVQQSAVPPPGSSSSGSGSYLSACQDGFDNDRDGLVDYPSDPGCTSPIDGNETNPPRISGPCKESWICSSWSDCRNGVNLRTCYDNNKCGTEFLRPDNTKQCTQISAVSQLPTETIPKPPVMAPPPVTATEKSFFSENLVLITGIPLALIALAGLIWLVLHFVKKKRIVYNVNELKNWIKREKSMGTSKDDIKSILAEHTGWSEEEVGNVFKELRSKTINHKSPLGQVGLNLHLLLEND